MVLDMRSLCMVMTFWFDSNMRMEVMRLAIASVGEVLEPSTKPWRTLVVGLGLG